MRILHGTSLGCAAQTSCRERKEVRPAKAASNTPDSDRGHLMTPAPVRGCVHSSRRLCCGTSASVSFTSQNPFWA
jgi:predicted secreted protein